MILNAGLGRSARNMVASAGPSPVRAMMMAKAAPSAPVISHLRPLMTKPLPSGSARTLSMAGIGAGAAVGLGHGEAGAHLARGQPLQVFLPLRRRCHHVEEVDVALVGRVKMQRDGTENGISGGFEDDRLLEVRKAFAAELLRAVDAEQAGLPGPCR